MPDQLEQSKKPKRRIGLVSGCLIVVVFFIALVALIAALGKGENTNTQTSTQATNATSGQSEATGLNIGEEGVLKPNNLDSVYLAIDEPSYDELSKALTANDTQGVVDLLSGGKIFEAATGSKVLVIDRKTFSRKVRILEGSKSVGKAGWLPYEWVVKQ